MRKNTRSRHNQILFMTQLAILVGIEAIFCFTPLGTIQIGPIAATLAMIPVIITSLLMGPKIGGIMGFFAGLFSFTYWTFIQPSNPSAIMFTPFHTFGEISSYWTLVICFVPRTLTGIIPALIYNFFKNNPKLNILGLCISSALASIINTLLVLLGTYFLWGKDYATASSIEYAALLGLIGTVILTNGIPEAIIAAIISPITVKPLSKFLEK
jgi:uncharacterized membrane protein